MEPSTGKCAPPENIFLLGLMGAGKTTAGKLLAKRLNKEFYDCDHEIERRTGVTIPVIFELEGEAGFRARESSVVAELTRLKNIVLATGGGVVLSRQNRDLLAANGTVVYLRAPLQDLIERTRHHKNRPLLNTPDPHATLEELYRVRDPLYREIADIVVDTKRQNVMSLVRELEKQLSSVAPCKH